jgi:CheY-like chemotaxis protein
MDGVNLMRGSHTVALVGFSQQEASILESFLRQAARDALGYRMQDEVMDAQILIVNADNPQALHLVRRAELPARVMLIGKTDGGTGWPLQCKPVRLAAVLAELNRIAGIQTASAADNLRSIADSHPRSLTSPRPSMETRFPATEYASGTSLPPMAPTASPGRRSRDSEFPSTRPMRRADLTPPLPAAIAAASLAKPTPMPPLPARRVMASASTAAQRPGVLRMTNFGDIEELPLPPARAVPNRRSSDSQLPSNQPPAPGTLELPRGEALLVAESLVEGRTLLKRFKKYGLSVDWSRESEQALVMLRAHSYRLVVIDRLSGQPDAFQVCRTAKQEKHGGQAPVVVVFAAIAGSMDRLKAGLAGCDAYLSRSVSEADLYKLLAQHRLVNLDAFARTNIGI